MKSMFAIGFAFTALLSMFNSMLVISLLFTLQKSNNIGSRSFYTRFPLYLLLKGVTGLFVMAVLLLM